MALNQILSIPSNSNGLSPVSGVSAWTYGSWVAFTTSLPTDGYITGITFQNQAIPSLDTTQQFLFEVGIGAAGAEVVKLQVPYSFRQDTNIGIYLMPVNSIYLPEPFFVHGGSRISVRVADSIANALTYNNAKLMYRDAGLPTTVLNSPANGSSGSNLMPTLNFTGTDVNGNVLEYEVQLDTTDTFDSIDIGESLVSSYTEDNYDTLEQLCSDVTVYQKVGQSFKGTGTKITSAKFYISKVGSPTGTAVACLYLATGTSGVDAVPTGSVLATSDTLEVSKLTGTLSLIIFTFTGSNQYPMTAGTNYVLTLEYPYGGAIDFLYFGFDSSSATHEGNICGYIGLSWTYEGNYDLIFYVYGSVSGPLVDAVSTTDAGFTAGHPFASGSAKDYTVQSALSLATYYWRVRAKDPSGTNTFGAWSATWSFFVTSAAYLIKYWTGSTWGARPLKYYTGSTWATKPLKVYTGTQWITIN